MALNSQDLDAIVAEKSLACCAGGLAAAADFQITVLAGATRGRLEILPANLAPLRLRQFLK